VIPLGSVQPHAIELTGWFEAPSLPSSVREGPEVLADRGEEALSCAMKSGRSVAGSTACAGSLLARVVVNVNGEAPLVARRDVSVPIGAAGKSVRERGCAMIDTSPPNALDPRVAALLPLPGGERAELEGARFGGDVLFAMTHVVDAPHHAHVVAWPPPHREPPKLLAHFKFAAPARCELMPSPDGGKVLALFRFDESWLGDAAGLLFLLSRDAEAPLTFPTQALARVWLEEVDEAAGWLEGGRQLHYFSTCHVRDGARRLARFIYDVDAGALVDFQEASEPPTHAVNAANPNRAALASAHGADLDVARRASLAITDPEIANTVATIINQRAALDAIRRSFGADHDVACAAFREALRITPDWASAYDRLSELLRDKGELQPMLAACEDWCRALPDDAEAHLRRAVALAQLGKLAAALEAACRAAECDADTAAVIGAEDGLEPLRGLPAFARFEEAARAR
jgi:hypothetical protein